MQLEQQVLEDAFVRLEALGEQHRDDLYEACSADDEVWKTLYPISWDPDHFDATWAAFAATQASGQSMNYAVVAEGRCVGLTCFMQLSPANGSVEIGGTYYRPEVRGGPVNPAAKRLLLDSAFAAGARRVRLNVDAINARSRAAVLKLGATQEGILRQDRVCWTGRVRDTVVFSILAEEWPAVRDGLEARLARFSQV
ncbi:GNAT family N-acetyltransferase [Phenylobacterium immobile]|uniref:GNAT family N-acetyltransferase n=1 Tax=Phenylobacterium immobile TaxID=21 RepID=UPI000A7D9D25|nr:GNAT family protein [Phenylobacterium immobile]